jgi:opacity protein-like surface antigen
MNLTGKLLLATATVAAFSSGALAADLSMPMKPAPIMAPAASTSWDGPYVGAKIG